EPDLIDPALVDDAAELLVAAKDWQEAFALLPKPKARRGGEETPAGAAAAGGGVPFARRQGTSRAPRGAGPPPPTRPPPPPPPTPTRAACGPRGCRWPASWWTRTTWCACSRWRPASARRIRGACTCTSGRARGSWA